MTRAWQVATLGWHSAQRGESIIPISSRKFKEVLSLLSEKGYKRIGHFGSETEYRCDLTRSALFINSLAKTIRAEAFSESGISAVIDDFNLPAYKGD